MTAIGLGVTPAMAACDTTAPASGATVTCAPPGIETSPVSAPEATAVTVNFQSGAMLQTADSPAIDLGGGAWIDMAPGSMIADFDPADLPSNIEELVQADLSVLPTRQDYLDRQAEIRDEPPVRSTPASPTVKLGATDPAANQDAIVEITTAVTIGKAKIADIAQNAVRAVQNDEPLPTVTAPSLETPTPEPSAGGANDVVLNGGAIYSAGSSGVSSPNGSALNVHLTDSTLATFTENAPGIVSAGTTDITALAVTLDNSAISTFSEGSAGVAAGQNSGLSIQLVNGARIATVGDHAAAVQAAGADSAVLFEARGPLDTSEQPMIATFGDFAPGFVKRGDNATTVINIANVGSGLYGPGMQTNGSESTLFDIAGETNTSISVFAQASSLATFGAQSAVFDLSPGTESVIDMYLDGVDLHSAGDYSPLIASRLEADSSATIVVVNSMLKTLGDNSAGVMLRNAGANTSSETLAVLGSTVDTSGDGSPALLIEAGGASAARTVFLSDSSFFTHGADSAGVTIGGMGPSSGSDIRLASVVIETEGAGSHGLVLGEGLGNGTSHNLRISDLSVTTSGDRANALVIAEGTTLTLDDAYLGATTNAATIVNGTIDSFDNLVATGSQARAIQNNGTIFGTVAIGASAIGNLANNGLIEAGASDGGVAVDFAGSTDDIFELQTQGTVIGRVLAGDGDDRFILGGEGAQTFDLGLVDFDGNDEGEQYLGFERFEKEDASAWTVTGSNDELLSAAVIDGTLFVNALLTNAAFDLSGGTLGGSGTLGSFVAHAGSMVSPGNSIGTLTVIGDAGFESGSTFEVEVAGDGVADQVAADTATITGGTVSAIATGPFSSFTVGTQSVIIDTTSGRTGTFDSLIDDNAFIDFVLVYDNPDQVILEVADVTTDFTSVAETYNQRQAATGLNDLELTSGSDSLAVYEEIGVLSEDEARMAFDLTSGEIHASAQRLVDDTFDLLNRALRRRGTDGLAKPASDQRFWLNGLGGRGVIGADGNAATADWRAGGLAVGYEGEVDAGVGDAFAGLALGYLLGDSALDDRLSEAQTSALQLGAYGGWTDGQWRLSAAFGYAAGTLSTERGIVFGGIDRRATADYWTQTVGVSAEVAYDISLDSETIIAPLFALDAAWSGHGDFAETGAGALNLSGDASGWFRLDAGLGVSATKTFVTRLGALTLEARAVWEHAFADATPSQTLAFAGSPTAFDVRGPEAERDRLRLGLGASMSPSEDLTISASYDGLYSGQHQNHTANLGLNVKF